MRTRSAKPEWQTDIARERMEILLGLARKFLTERPERSRRYVGLARKIGTRYNVRMPVETKEGFCKRCDSLMVPGRTMSTRIDSRTKSVAIKCLGCEYVYRKRYK